MGKKRIAFFSIFLFLAINVFSLSNAIEAIMAMKIREYMVRLSSH